MNLSKYKQIVKNRKIMEGKEIKINVPEGYEIDKEKSSFEHIVFKKKENKLPKTWEEFCENYSIKDTDYFIDSSSSIRKRCSDLKIYRCKKEDKFLLPSKELAEAMLALCQLIQLRDCYNDGWVPDWESIKYKYCIDTYHNKILKEIRTDKNIILAFKEEGLRNQFYENFKDLIEIAKPLL